MKSLYLVDSSIYIFNAWHALPTSITDNNKHPANAVFGFTEFLLQLIEHEKPDLMVCAFDAARELATRKRIYPEYKSHRTPPPLELTQQIVWCREFAEAMGIKCFSNTKLEADDIIGTFAVQANNQGLRNIILSADKDLTQFIHSDDIFWDYARKKRFSFRDIRKRFNLHPGQIADMLALAGDKTDNIPGIPGVGIPAAVRLLIKWGNLDNLFANADKVSSMKFRGAPHIAKLLPQYQQQVYLSRELTGLIPDTSLPNDCNSLGLQSPKRELLTELYDKFEFDDARRTRWDKALSGASTQI